MIILNDENNKYLGRINHHVGYGRLGKCIIFRSDPVGMDESSVSVSPWTRGVVFRPFTPN